MKIEKTSIPGVLEISPKVFKDRRGYFLESYNKKAFSEAGIAENFVQDNHSRSSEGVVRGLHYQEKHPQGKLIKVAQGKVLDVVADIRRDSPAFGQWIGIILSSKNNKQLWAPPGVAHGFSVLSNTVDLLYKVTDYYCPEDERGIRWDDPWLNIDWQVKSPILSDKDKNLPFLKEIMRYS